MVRREADQHRVVGPGGTDELADVELAAGTELCCARVADVGVVFPNDHLRASQLTIEVNGQRNPDAAWYYPEPKDAAKQIAGYIAFWKGVKVEG